MLIGANGKKTAGKDTLYTRIAKLTKGTTVYRVSFADKLYKSAAAALGVTVAQLLEWKNDPTVLIEITNPDTNLQAITVREYLQWYGTEAHRKVFGEDFWVDQALPLDFDHHGGIYVVTDCRFPNEAARVQDLGGFVVSIVGPPEVESAGDAHESEEPLPAGMVDWKIDNSVRDDDFSNLDNEIRTFFAWWREVEKVV